MKQEGKQPKKENEDGAIIDDGFSSEEQLEHEQIIIEQDKKQTLEPHHKETVKFKIPPPQQIKDKAYSLKPDQATGWNKKIQLPSPIPIIFESSRIDNLIKKMLKSPKSKAKLCYLGPRYENTYYSWYDKNFSFPYDHIKAPNNMKFTNRPFCGQHWEAEEGLVFNSFFQSGNLDSVIQIGERQYDCFMRVDSNTAGHLMWYNFKINNLKKLLKYKINICNFQKDKCLYARGMKPYIFSSKKFLEQNIGWHQAGENIRFERKPVHAAKVYQMDMKSMFRLSFEYYSGYEEDEIQVCYCVPYTYSHLSQFLHFITKKPESKKYLKMSKLCTSLGGLEVPLLIIHQKANQQEQKQQKHHPFELDQVQKKCVVISGRAHPGESNGSYMMEGFIEFLTSDNKMALYLRKHIVFKIVPMLNPDGVALGNYRTGLSGRDFNRQYRNPDKQIFPEVFHFKKLVTENKLIFKQNLIMFLDFHGHSTKKNTFMYGPEFPIIDKNYYECRIFPKLIGNASSMFRYYSCTFKINEFKQTTARAILLRKLFIPLSYTIQASNGFYFDYEQLKDVPYTIEKWVQMGQKIGQALKNYTELVVVAQSKRIEKFNNKKKAKEAIKKINHKNKHTINKIVNQQPISIFSAMENQTVKLLFEEIKKAENAKQMEKISDDQMEEGSSDGQGEDNDLPKEKVSYLFSMIKNRGFKSLSRCRMRTRLIDKDCNKSNQSDNSTKEVKRSLIQQQLEEQSNTLRISQQIFVKKNSINARRPSASKEKVFNFEGESKKIKPAAKIINFSFISDSSSQKRRSYDKPSSNVFMPSKLNFLELVSGKWNEEKNRQKSRDQFNRTRMVMDFSNQKGQTGDVFRKTYQTKQEADKILQLNNLYMSTKKSRFQQYKYKRLLLNEGQL